MVIGPARLKTVSACTANYRPALSSEWKPHFKNKALVRVKKRKGNIWSWAPKEGPTPRPTGRLTVGRNVDVDDDDVKRTQFLTGSLFLLEFPLPSYVLLSRYPVGDVLVLN
jgi:hypothetical protein